MAGRQVTHRQDRPRCGAADARLSCRYTERAASRLGHGEGCKCAHAYEEGAAPQEYLGVDATYYEPADRGHEAKIKKRLEEFKRLRREEPPKKGKRKKGK